MASVTHTLLGVRSIPGIQKRNRGYAIQVTHKGKRYAMMGIKTVEDARLARDALAHRLKNGLVVTLIDEDGEVVGTSPAPTSRRLYLVNQKANTVSGHLRTYNFPATSFYRLQRQTKLRIKYLLHLLFEDELSPNEIRCRFMAAKKTSRSTPT